MVNAFYVLNIPPPFPLLPPTSHLFPPYKTQNQNEDVEDVEKKDEKTASTRDVANEIQFRNFSSKKIRLESIEITFTSSRIANLQYN